MTEPTQPGRHFGFLLVDKFSMFSLAAAIDTVRSANRLLGRDFYGWKTVSADSTVPGRKFERPMKSATKRSTGAS